MTPLPPAFLDRPIAHRALHGPGRPENSREAIEAAIAKGYGIELDVQASADTVPMVFHDYGLDRLTGIKGTVQTTSARDLGQIQLTGGPSGIPTLGQVLDQVAGRAPLLIEIKDQDGALGPNVGPLEAAVARALQGYHGDVALMSFNPHAVLALADTGRPLGLTTCNYDAEDWPLVPAARRAQLAQIPDAETLNVAFISHQWDQLDAPAVAAARAAGRAVFCWTIRSQAQAAEALRRADNITFEGFVPDPARPLDARPAHPT